MSKDDFRFFFIIILAIALFWGEPDLVDSLIAALQSMSAK